MRRLIVNDFLDLGEALSWANSLIDKPVPGYALWIVQNIIQFQVMHFPTSELGWTLIVLVEMRRSWP